MALTILPPFRAFYMNGGTLDLDTADLRWVIVDAGHTATLTYAGDEFLDDLAASSDVAYTSTIANTTVTNGVLDGDDATITDPGGGTDAGTQAFLYLHTGVDATARLICHESSAAISWDGVDDTVAHNPSGIFQL